MVYLIRLKSVARQVYFFNHIVFVFTKIYFGIGISWSIFSDKLSPNRKRFDSCQTEIKCNSRLWRSPVVAQGDNRLSFRPHFAEKAKISRITLARIYPVIGPKSDLSLKNNIRLFKVILRPKMLYASPIWTYALHYKRKPLQVFKNKPLRATSEMTVYVWTWAIFH